MRVLTLISLFLISCANMNSGFLMDPKDMKRQCTNKNMYTVSKTLPDNLRSEVVDAFDHWNESLGKDIFVDSDTTMDLLGEGAWAMVGVEVDDRPLWNGHHCVQTLIHSTPSCIIGAKITITKPCSKDPKMFNTAIRHGIGNMLGLSNTVMPGTLMDYQWQPEAQHPIDLNEDEIKRAKYLLGLD